MISQFMAFTLAQRIMVVLLAFALGLAGYMAYQDLPIDAFPDVSSTQVKVVIKAPGMTPEEVEARITALVEVELLGIPKQVGLRSVAKYALTDITIDFEDGTDIYWARQQVAERLNAVWPSLPTNSAGGMAPMTTPLGEMFMFTVESPSLSLKERRSLLDWVIRPQLRTVAGVADVNALGGLVKTFEIVPNNAQLLARGIPLGDLMQALQDNNQNDGAGRLVEGEEALLVRAEGAFQTLDDVNNTVVRSEAGILVRVADVAEVRLGSLTRYGAVTQNGQGETVEGLVLGLRGANARQVVEGVRAKLADMQHTLPKDVTINVFYDRGHLVDRAVHTVNKALVEAIVLVIILLALFLGNLRAAITIAFILPLSVLSTFWLMRHVGLSANLMSLGGLAIAIGMLVDSAVVVVENIVSHLAQASEHSVQSKHARMLSAMREVSLPVASGIAIIMLVFLPLLTLQGLEGKLFSPVALTIIFALGSSLLLSLTVIPALASFLLKQGHHDEPWLIRTLTALYAPLLTRCMQHVRWVLLGALALMLLAIAVYWQMGKTFMPTMDEGDIIVGVEKVPSIALDQSVDTDQRIQRALLKQVPEIKGVYSRVGSDELGLDPMGLNQTDNFLVLQPPEQWHVRSKEALVEKIRQVMMQLPGLDYSFTQPIEMRVNEMILGVRGDLAIKLFGPDLIVLAQKSQEIKRVLEGITGSQDVYTPQNSGVQYLRIQLDRAAIGRLGLSVKEVNQLLQTQLEGQVIGVVQESGRRTPVLMRGEQSLRYSPDQFSAIALTLPSGEQIALKQLAKLERTEGPVKIDRERGVRMVVITSNVQGRDLVSFVEEAKAKVGAQVTLPEGYQLTWGGQFENQQRAAKRLAIVVPMAIGMVFLLLYLTFGSVRLAILILANIPLAMMGGVFALGVAGEYLSVPASVGFIALLGIAVLNGVVMISYFKQLEYMGMPFAQIPLEGAKRRLRPVLMTASITAFGLIPLLFATGPGSEIQRPLAIVVIGGLVTSTLLTLLLLPSLYSKWITPMAGTTDEHSGHAALPPQQDAQHQH